MLLNLGKSRGISISGSEFLFLWHLILFIMSWPCRMKSTNQVNLSFIAREKRRLRIGSLNMSLEWLFADLYNSPFVRGSSVLYCNKNLASSFNDCTVLSLTFLFYMPTFSYLNDVFVLSTTDYWANRFTSALPSGFLSVLHMKWRRTLWFLPPFCLQAVEKL